MDEIDRILADVIGPGLDHNWTAEARTIASRMHEAHGLPQLDEAAIEELANELDGIDFAGRPNLRVAPIDKTAEHAALEAVRKHADALRLLLDPDTPFGGRFQKMAERALDKNAAARRIAPKRQGPTFELDDGSTVGLPRSPIAGLPTRLAFASLVAADEAGRLKRTPQRRRSASWRADVIGQRLPALYAGLYPNAGIGTWDHVSEKRTGPRHLFVQLCAAALGFDPGTADGASKAALRAKARAE